MRKLFYKVLILLVTTYAQAQGCSDTGICSIGHSFDASEKVLTNNIEITAIFGKGDADIIYPHMFHILEKLASNFP